MRLSIITINYNNLKGLKKTIESVCSQTFRDYEWIVIDGGSTDGSRELIEENKSHIHYWVSEPDNGIYHAMNKGIAQAKGDYCQFLNSGDYYIAPNTLQQVFSHDELADVNYGDQWCIKDGKVVEKRVYPDQINLTYLFRAPLGHQAAFFRTSVIKEHLYKEQYHISADRAFFLELYVHGFQFKHFNLPIVYFDTEGIGSNIKTLAERRRQFRSIKREYFSDQVVADIERLISETDNYQFVCRVAPLRWTYNLFRAIQRIRAKWR